MNTNYKLIKEQKNVIISNDKGHLKAIPYQDNFEDILKEENVIEELENLLNTKNNAKQDTLNEINELSESIENHKKNRQKYWVKIIAFLILTPIIAPIIMNVCLKITIENFILTKDVILGSAILGEIFTSIFLLADAPISLKTSYIKNLEQEKKQAENNITEYDTEILNLKLLIEENKAKLNDLIKDKTSTNMRYMPEQITKISYRQELEQEKHYLEQMIKYNKQSSNKLSLTKTLK